jgi:DAK2 domain fusion protein YloV
MAIKHMDGEWFKKVVVASYNWLSNKKDEVNSLNVFPVPDGDTGTNMALTLLSAVERIKDKVDRSIAKVAGAVAEGALMGARGNSGVILSQIFMGFAEGIKDKDHLAAKDVAYAFKSAADASYRSVVNPVEGTILTVIREAADRAVEAAEIEDDIIAVLEAFLSRAKETLELTPDMLPVLKEAGVVDAGGLGLVHIVEGMLSFMKAGRMVEAADVGTSAGAVMEHIVDLTYGYCTEFMIRGAKADMEEMKRVLSELGDSLLVVGSPELVRVHVHTDHPGKALEYGVSLGGSLSKIKIDNMREQQEGFYAARKKADSPPARKEAPKPRKAIGIVSVAPGDGIAEVLRSMGADEIVDGGQTMNPSVEELLKAVEKVNADKVIILPNNKNIVLAAEQADKASSREISVVPSKSVPQGVAAITAFNSHNDLETNLRAMAEAMSKVKTGEVTMAVRDVKNEGVNVKKGDIIALYDGRIRAATRSCEEAILSLIRQMAEDGGELATLFYGKDVEKKAAETLTEKLREEFPDIDFELYYGGQPHYFYILSVE